MMHPKSSEIQTGYKVHLYVSRPTSFSSRTYESFFPSTRGLQMEQHPSSKGQGAEIFLLLICFDRSSVEVVL